MYEGMVAEEGIDPCHKGNFILHASIIEYLGVHRMNKWNKWSSYIDYNRTLEADKPRF